MSDKRWLFYRTKCHKSAKKHKHKRACLPAPVGDGGGGAGSVETFVFESGALVPPLTSSGAVYATGPATPPSPTLANAQHYITGPGALIEFDLTIEGLVAMSLGVGGFVTVALYNATDDFTLAPIIVVAGEGATPPTVAPNRWIVTVPIESAAALSQPQNDIYLQITVVTGGVPPPVVTFQSLRAVVRIQH